MPNADNGKQLTVVRVGALSTGATVNICIHIHTCVHKLMNASNDLGHYIVYISRNKTDGSPVLSVNCTHAVTVFA